jgi:hypothetical protein
VNQPLNHHKLTLVIILFFESSLLMYFQWKKNYCSVQRVIVFGSLSLERFLTLSSTDFYFFWQAFLERIRREHGGIDLEWLRSIPTDDAK